MVFGIELLYRLVMLLLPLHGVKGSAFVASVAEPNTITHRPRQWYDDQPSCLSAREYSNPLHQDSLQRRRKQVTAQSGPLFASSSESRSTNPNPSNKQQNSKDKKDEPLTPERVAELVEVSFVNGVMQLSQGYVDVLKLFIAAVQSGYGLGMSPHFLLDKVASCLHQSANRPLMDEETKLRADWIQLIYLVLDHVKYQDKRIADLELGIDGTHKNGTPPPPQLDPTIAETYAEAIPILARAKQDVETFEAESILQKCSHVLPQSSSDPIEKAILLQSLRVIWLTLTVLEEEALCIEDKQPVKPRPQIPGAFD